MPEYPNLLLEAEAFAFVVDLRGILRLLAASPLKEFLPKFLTGSQSVR